MVRLRARTPHRSPTSRYSGREANQASASASAWGMDLPDWMSCCGGWVGMKSEVLLGKHCGSGHRLQSDLCA